MSKSRQRNQCRISVGGLCFPKPGETVSGDNWGMMASETDLMIMVADGLGHGHEAGAASIAAIEMIVRYEKNTRKLRYCALGNVATCILGLQKRQVLINHDGTAGFPSPTIRQQEYDVPRRTLCDASFRRMWLSLAHEQISELVWQIAINCCGHALQRFHKGQRRHHHRCIQSKLRQSKLRQLLHAAL